MCITGNLLWGSKDTKNLTLVYDQIQPLTHMFSRYTMTGAQVREPDSHTQFIPSLPWSLDSSSVLVGWLHPEEKQTSHPFIIRGSCVTWSQVPAQVRLLPSLWDWEPGHLNICISKRWLPALKLTEEMITFSKGYISTFQRGKKVQLHVF